MDTCGTPLVTDFHLGMEALTVNKSLDEPIQPSNHPSVKVMSVQSRGKTVVGDHIKGLTEGFT